MNMGSCLSNEYEIADVIENLSRQKSLQGWWFILINLFCIFVLWVIATNGVTGVENHNVLNRQFKNMCCKRRSPIFYLPEGKQLLEESFLLYLPMSLGDPMQFLIPAFLLLLAIMNLFSYFLFSLFLTGIISSVPCSSGLSTTLTFGKGICKWRNGQGITVSKLASLQDHINSCSPTLSCILGWVFTFPRTRN